MATQEMILKLSFDDEGTFTGLEDINQELAKTDAATTQLEKSTKTLKAQYAELKKQQDQFDPGTEKFNELSQKMGELKDRMNDAAEAVKGNTGPAIEGARASFGMLGEQMLNLDFEGVAQSVNLVSGNIARIKPADFANGLKAIGTAGVNAFKAIGKVILANPLLAVAGALIAIAMNFDKIIKYIPALEKGLTGINEQDRESLRISKAKAEASKKTVENFDLQTNALRLQGKTEREILTLKMSQMKISLEDAVNQLGLSEKQAQVQIETAHRNKDILEGIMSWINKPILFLLNTIDDVSKAMGKGSAGLADKYNAFTTQMVFDTSEVEAGLAKNIQENKDAINKMKSDYEGIQLDIQKIDSDAAKSKNDKAKAARDQAKQDADEARKEAEAAALQVEKEMADFEKSKMKAIDLEKFEANEKYAIQKKAFEDAKRSKEELEKLEQQHTTILADIDAKYLKEKQAKEEELRLAAQQKADEQFTELQKLQSTAKENEINEAVLAAEKLQELAVGNAALEIAIQEDLKTKIGEINKKFHDEEVKAVEESEKKKQELRMANIQSNFEMASLALDTLSSLNEAATKGDEASQRKAFERNKMIQKAQATIAMASGIVQQLAVPQDQLTGMNFVKAAAVAAAGVANIVKINQTQFGGSGSGGGNGNLNAPTGGGANAPAIDFSGANLQVNAPGSTETYVLAGNVANALEARQKIIDQSHL